MSDSATQPARLFTIGHSNHEYRAFQSLLARHGITTVADVRSQPYSQHTPQFNRDVVERLLRADGHYYVFMGDELGARRGERSCYVGGQAKYELVAQLPAFRQGLERIRRGVRTQTVALMCSEKDPITCHRTILVCRALRGPGMEIVHVLEDGTLESTESAEGRLLDLFGLPPGDLFRGRAELVELAYERQGQKIAYREGTEEQV